MSARPLLVAAVFARVLVDGLRDPTSHNLWPIEIVIASIIGGGRGRSQRRLE